MGLVPLYSPPVRTSRYDENVFSPAMGMDIGGGILSVNSYLSNKKYGILFLKKLFKRATGYYR